MFRRRLRSGRVVFRTFSIIFDHLSFQNSAGKGSNSFLLFSITFVYLHIKNIVPFFWQIYVTYLLRAKCGKKQDSYENSWVEFFLHQTQSKLKHLSHLWFTAHSCCCQRGFIGFSAEMVYFRLFTLSACTWANALRIVFTVF